MPVSPARLASNGLSYIGKAPTPRSRRRDCPQIASLIQASPPNPSFAGETGLKQPLLYRQGPKIPVPPAGLASYSLSYMGKTTKSQSRRRDRPQKASLIFLWLQSRHSRPEPRKMSCVSPANKPKRSRTRRTHMTRTTLGAKCGVAPGTC